MKYDNASFLIGAGRRGETVVRIDLCAIHGFRAHEFRWLEPKTWERECLGCRADKRERERGAEE